MNNKFSGALAIAAMALCTVASAQSQGAADPQTGGGSVRQQTRHLGHSVHHGVRATGHAIHKGVRATGHAIHKGVRATGHAIHHGVNELTGK